MKLIHNTLLVAALLALNASAQPTPTPPPSTKPAPPPPPFAQPGPRVPPGLVTPPRTPAIPPKMPDKDKLSYAIGMNIGNSIKRDKIDIDVDTIATAMKDIIAGSPTRLTEGESREVMTQFNGAMRARAAAEMAESKAKGEEFLTNNAKAPGVKTLPDGLQYKALKEGDGPMPKPSDTVTVSYKGRLIDGTVFDQNTNFTTAVTGRTIQGWSKILPLMKTGSKWEVTIPSELGYGPRGTPPGPGGAAPKVGPNAVLIFEMELLSIATPPPAPAPMPASAPHSAPPNPPTAMTTTPVVSGQIIKVPSKEELDKGAKIEVITNTNVPPSK